MGEKMIIDSDILTGIADAIRFWNGETTSYKPSEMANAILALDVNKIFPEDFLPEAKYTRVSCINTTTKPAYINTDYFLLGDNYKIKIKFNVPTLASQSIIGFQPSSYNLIVLYNGKLYWGASNSGSDRVIIDSVYSAGLNELVIEGSSRVLKITTTNGTVKTVNTNTNFISSSYSLYIFTNNLYSTGPTTQAALNTSIYYFKIYKDNELIMDLIPCIRKEDNAVGMFESQSNKFYGSATDNSFTYTE